MDKLQQLVNERKELVAQAQRIIESMQIDVQMITSRDYKAGLANGKQADFNHPLYGHLYQDNIRKAQMGIKSTSKGIREYWQGWLDGAEMKVYTG